LGLDCKSEPTVYVVKAMQQLLSLTVLAPLVYAKSARSIMRAVSSLRRDVERGFLIFRVTLLPEYLSIVRLGAVNLKALLQHSGFLLPKSKKTFKRCIMSQLLDIADKLYVCKSKISFISDFFSHEITVELSKYTKTGLVCYLDDVMESVDGIHQEINDMIAEKRKVNE